MAATNQTLTEFLEGIADAIRYAENSTSSINAQDFVSRIRLLRGGQPQPEPSNIVHVGIGEEYAYHKIKDAENAVEDGGTILIHEGVYEEYGIGRVNKELTYEGINKETCIVQNGWGDKEYSVFDLNNANKTVKNLTIHQTDLEPVNPDVSSVAYKAYGVHSDSESCEGHTYTIENCIIKNKTFACVGLGLWQDHMIILKDCDLDTYDSNPYGKEMGAYYCHSNTYSDDVTGQNIVLINNTIHAHNTKAIKIDISKRAGSEMTLEFIDNTCTSDLYGTTEECCSVNENEYTKIKDTSKGNNISKLNYVQPSPTTELLEVTRLQGMKLQENNIVSKPSTINTYLCAVEGGKTYYISTDVETYSITVAYNTTGGTTSGTEVSGYDVKGIGMLTNLPVRIPDGMTYMYMYNLNGGTETRFTVSTSPYTPPVYPVIPQTGTWQLKSTPTKKYVIISTDDDNEGNADFFRLLRSYGFPYTMNIEAENLSKNIGKDTNQPFSESDAPSLFPNGVTVTELAKYIHDNNLGEVTQHGSSLGTLWDSDMLTGTVLDNLYNDYTSKGGVKTKEQFKTAVMESAKSGDVRQGASYVAESREAIQNAVGFDIEAVALWGGTPTAEVDGISVNLNAIKSGGYDWRADNYKYVGSRIGQAYQPTYGIYGKFREWHNENIGDEIDKIAIGDVVDFYSHMPYLDLGNDKLRQMCDGIKAYVDRGEVEVITPSQYYAMGEWVENPIVSISLTRDGNINEGDSDDLSKYKTVATYQDGSTADVSNEAIVDNSAVITSAKGNYNAYVTYRGFNTSCVVSVVKSGMTYPEGLKDQECWFVADNETKNVIIALNTTGQMSKLYGYEQYFSTPGPYFTSNGGMFNLWSSDNGGITWTQEVTNERHYGSCKFRSDSVSQGDKLVLIEDSGNFEKEYI